jgi:hypothetical protein
MDFNAFAQSRDLLCLSGVFTGLAAGCLLSHFRTGMSRRSRNRGIVLSLLCFSGTVAALAAAIIVSLGAIFKDGGVIAAALFCIPVFTLIVRFPRTVAYPLILAGGLVVVWLGYTFLRFPLAQTSSVPTSAGAGNEIIINETAASSVPLAYISSIEENRYIISFSASIGDRAQIAPLQITGGLSGVQFSAAFISFQQYIPLVGGTVRGMITEISRNAEVIYANTSIQSPFAYNLRNVNLTLPFETIPLGVELSVQYDGASLIFITDQ